MRTTVVNLRTEPFDVYVGRAGKGHDGYFGNPFSTGTRETNISNFKRYFLQRVAVDQVFRQRVLALRGKRLGCFCRPEACHGQVIAEWIDAQFVEAA